MSGEAVLQGFEPTPQQLEAARATLDPAGRVILLDGAIRSGKTQAAARILLEWAVGQPATYLVARATYRSLRDSTMKALVFGDGGMPPLIPGELVEAYRASDEKVVLRNGAEILFRSLEEGQVSKILNLSLAGVLVDQVEEIDGGDEGERLWDTLLGRLSDPRGPRKLLAVANPAGLTSWQYRRLVDKATRDAFVRRVSFRLTDNAVNLPADYVEAMQATAKTRPAWFRSFVLGEWGAFEGAAYAEFEERTHVVPAFDIPEHWERFESMDHGAANPTAWLFWAADEDGNLIVTAEHYRASWLVSQHAATVKRLRRILYGAERDVRVYADPSTGAKQGLTDKWGAPASVVTEYREHGVTIGPANNDRLAGYSRLRELLHVDLARPFPGWHVRYGERGAPRLFVVGGCTNLAAQLKSAPVAAEGPEAGQAVEGKWESTRGHAHAALRYGAMSWQGPSPEAMPAPPTDPKARFLYEVERKRREKRWGQGV